MALVGLMALTDACHAAPAWLRRAFTLQSRRDARTDAPVIGRYRSDAGNLFILDRTAARPLLKFDDSPEVWVLTASRGARGDMIYTSDLGRPLVRTTRLGGVTVFTASRPAGSAAVSVGAGAPLRLVTLGPAGLYRALLQASARASRAAQHLIGFEAPDADPLSDGLIADAAAVAGEAVIDLAAQDHGRSILARLARVEIVRGGRPGASLRGGVVNITVTPALGVAGRPSSERILFAVGAR